MFKKLKKIKFFFSCIHLALVFVADCFQRAVPPLFQIPTMNETNALHLQIIWLQIQFYLRVFLWRTIWIAAILFTRYLVHIFCCVWSQCNRLLEHPKTGTDNHKILTSQGVNASRNLMLQRMHNASRLWWSRTGTIHYSVWCSSYHAPKHEI